MDFGGNNVPPAVSTLSVSKVPSGPPLTTACYSCSEIAMILICSSLPLLPKFFTLLFNRNTGLPSYTSSAKRGSSSRQNQGKSSKYSNSLATNIGVPWEHTNTSTSQLRNTYVPLKELEPSHSRYTEVSGSNVGGECASSESEAIRGDTHCNTITKTVKIECI